MGKNIISYSLWGDCKLYLQGAIDNIELAHKYYPGWHVRFYTASDCTALKDLQDIAAKDPLVEVVVMSPVPTLDKTKPGWENCPTHQAMLWRLYAFADPDAEYIISRDTDSRLSPREAAAVNEWIESGMLGHIMYEKDVHHNGVMVGLSGLVGGLFKSVQDMEISFNNFVHNYERMYPGQRWVFADIIYMRDWVFSNIAFSVMRHGFGTDNPFKVDMPPELGEFVGAVVNPEWRDEKYSRSS